MDYSLERADYRHRVAEIYLSKPTVGREGWEVYRTARDKLFMNHSQSALGRKPQVAILPLSYYEYNEDAIFITKIDLTCQGEQVAIETGGEDGIVTCSRVARLNMPIGTLTLFWILGYGGGLFLPFRDSTAGASTYGGGRYLTDTIKGTYGRGVVYDGSTVVVDFNYAYNPSCAYDPAYACPLAPRENWLDMPVLAGERSPVYI